MNVEGWQVEEWEGCGNHFYIPTEKITESGQTLKDKLSAFGRQVGDRVDGLLYVEPGEKVLHIINADGSYAANCGNGVRCALEYLYQRGKIGERAQLTIQDSITILGQRDADTGQWRICMGQPKEMLPVRDWENQIQDWERQVKKLVKKNFGNDHLVLIQDQWQQAEIQQIVRTIDPSNLPFNLHFVSHQGDEVTAIPFERGVGFTEACGSGACAVFAALVPHSNKNFSKELTVRMPGGELFCQYDKEGQVWLRGAANKV